MSKEITTKKILSITKNDRPQQVWDIQTEKNHNFFANKTLVHNCILYQESLQLIYHKLAGVPLEETDMVRKAFTKKDILNKEKAIQERNKLRTEFVTKCREANDIDEAVSGDIFDELEKYVSYSFNKCLDAETKITGITRSGTFFSKSIADVVPGDYAETRDEKTGNKVYTEVLAVHNNGMKKVFHFFLDDGTSVKCTEDHKFRTTDGRMLPIMQIMKENLDIVSEKFED
jgi:DNA polymerase-3 subunit alpha